MKNIQDYVETISDEKLKEAVNITFDKAFPDIIRQCEDRSTAVHVFISLFDMLCAVQETGSDHISLEKYTIYQRYPDFVTDLLAWVENIPSEDDKKQVFTAFKIVLLDIVRGKK